MSLSLIEICFENSRPFGTAVTGVATSLQFHGPWFCWVTDDYHVRKDA